MWDNNGFEKVINMSVTGENKEKMKTLHFAIWPIK